MYHPSDAYYALWKGYILDDIRGGKAPEAIKSTNDWVKATQARHGLRTGPGLTEERDGGARAHRDFWAAWRYLVGLSDDYPSEPTFVSALEAAGFRREPKGRAHSWGGDH